MPKRTRTYFIVSCKKEEKKALKDLAIKKGFENTSQFLRAIVRKELASG